MRARCRRGHRPAPRRRRRRAARRARDRARRRRARAPARRAGAPAGRRASAPTPGALPLRDGAADLALVVFAPRAGAELARVLAPGGAAIVATPLPHHLAELRAAVGLIGVDPGKPERLRAALAPELVPVARREVAFPLALDHDGVRALVAMGPARATSTTSTRGSHACPSRSRSPRPSRSRRSAPRRQLPAERTRRAAVRRIPGPEDLGLGAARYTVAYSAYRCIRASAGGGNRESRRAGERADGGSDDREAAIRGCGRPAF